MIKPKKNYKCYRKCLNNFAADCMQVNIKLSISYILLNLNVVGMLKVILAQKVSTFLNVRLIKELGTQEIIRSVLCHTLRSMDSIYL